MRAVLALLCVFLALASAQICVKYGGTAPGAQATLMENVINDVVGRVVADPVLLPWFDGRNNRGGINFTDPAQSAQLTNLGAKLIAFFGVALGCNAAEFTGTGKYTIGSSGTSTNMTAIHRQGAGAFNAAVTKAAYELFNIHIIDSLRGFGVANSDLLAVSTVLDTFRGPTLHPTSGTDNQVCQASDCNTAPFTVHASDVTNANYFSPSYLTVPVGGSVRFINTGARAHTATQGTYVDGGACTAATGGFNSGQLAATAAFTTPSGAFDKEGTVTFYCANHCNSLPNATQMVGMINVVGDGSGAAGLALALAAGLAALFAFLV